MTSTNSSENPLRTVPKAFCNEAGEIAPELGEEIRFGQKLYYNPRKDLRGLSAAYDSIHESKGKEAADTFATSVKTKAKFYRSEAQKLQTKLSSSEFKDANAAKIEETTSAAYLQARRISANNDVDHRNVLTTVMTKELGDKFQNDETSIIGKGNDGNFRPRTFWVAASPISQEDKHSLTDRGLQETNKVDRFYNEDGSAKTITAFHFSPRRVSDKFEISDPDTAEARDNFPQHIPFGYSSGGLREYVVSPKQEYIDSTVSKVKEANKSEGLGEVELEKKIYKAVNADVFGAKHQGIRQCKHAQGRESFRTLSFSNENGPYNLRLYEVDVKTRLEAFARKAQASDSKRLETNITDAPKTGPPEKKSGGAKAKADLLASMRTELAKNKKKGQSDTKSKGKAP